MTWLDRSLVTLPHYLGLCLTEKDFRKELKRLKVPREQYPEFLLRGAHATVHFFTKSDGDSCAIVNICSSKGATIHQVHALLVHEAVHVWQDARRILGEKEPSAEFEAYAIQSISQRLMEAYADLTKKRKKSK